MQAEARPPEGSGSEITLLYDGACPLCSREMAWLARLDRGRGRLAFEDISTPGFAPTRFGKTAAELDARIHGVLPDGSLLEGMDVFRCAYRAAGRGWLLAPTGWPLLRPLFDRFYRWFARNRHRLTGRVNCACVPD